MRAMDALHELCVDLAAGRVRIVDLTHRLTSDFPVMALPPELGQCAPYWNNISMSEHAGTHFDAPGHWITGRHLPCNTVDTIAPQRFVAPAAVLDYSNESAADEDFLLTISAILDWESRHGRIESGSWVLFRTDWHKHLGTPVFLNLKQDGPHSPGPAADAARFLVEERDILGFGTETVGTDAGQASYFSPPYPAHHFLHGAGRYGLQCLANLDQLPPKGAVVIAAPLKIRDGSGSPLRALALTANA
jgi:kynurenine formamidase